MPTSGSGYCWRLGDIEITRVLEFEAALFEPTVIHPDVTPEILESHRSRLEPTLLNPDSDLLVFAFHSTVIRTPRATILVDTCSGNDKERPHKQRYHRKNWPYLANLAAAGFAPISTPIMSAGTHGSSMADGCRRFPMPAICLRSKNGNTGSAPNRAPDTRPIPITRTVCCQSWRAVGRSWW